MAKFNLNQILNDASRAAAKCGEPTPRPAESRMEKISVYDLVPSEDNFYSIREIEELKAAIEIAGKVLQNLVVVPLDGGKYKVIAGHRRRLASISLVEEGKPQYEFVPCDVEPNEEAAEDQEVRDGLMLIVTNSQREKTAWDKIEEVRYLREVLEKARTKPRFVALLQQIVAQTFGSAEVQADGTRDFIAKVLHTSTTQIGRYDAIIRNLCPDFKAELKEDRINVSTAYELSGLAAEEQQAAFAEYQRTGEISIKAARERKTPPPAERTEQETPPPAPRTATQPPEAAGREETYQPTERPAEGRTEPPKQADPPAKKPISAAGQTDEAGNQPPAEREQQEPPKQPEETRCVDGGICPYCGGRFDAAEAVNYSTLGTQTTGPINCPHCGKPVKIFCSVEYFCSPAEE